MRVISPIGFGRHWAERLESIGRRFCGRPEIFGVWDAAFASKSNRRTAAPTFDRIPMRELGQMWERACSRRTMTRSAIRTPTCWTTKSAANPPSTQRTGSPPRCSRCGQTGSSR
ncbi:hypothetical protein E3W21_22900 [Pseudomonas sp. F01002]|nr:hypothetical protein CUN63_07455 [Pseudomonas sp. ACM7]TFB36228.1 hypothetical protein E3W21_22900 [Pseudomonas sp. F01002]